jgi:hypothetical protein
MWYCQCRMPFRFHSRFLNSSHYLITSFKSLWYFVSAGWHETNILLVFSSSFPFFLSLHPSSFLFSLLLPFFSPSFPPPFLSFVFLLFSFIFLFHTFTDSKL